MQVITAFPVVIIYSLDEMFDVVVSPSAAINHLAGQMFKIVAGKRIAVSGSKGIPALHEFAPT